jgi:hypothetical protein
MSRAYHKGWQDKRPGFTRRVRWLQGDDIRLEFIDPGGRVSLFFDGPDMIEDATEKYEAFIQGDLTTFELQDQEA